MDPKPEKEESLELMRWQHRRDNEEARKLFFFVALPAVVFGVIIMIITFIRG